MSVKNAGYLLIIQILWKKKKQKTYTGHFTFFSPFFMFFNPNITDTLRKEKF